MDPEWPAEGQVLRGFGNQRSSDFIQDTVRDIWMDLYSGVRGTLERIFNFNFSNRKKVYFPYCVLCHQLVINSVFQVQIKAAVISHVYITQLVFIMWMVYYDDVYIWYTILGANLNSIFILLLLKIFIYYF